MARKHDRQLHFDWARREGAESTGPETALLPYATTLARRLRPLAARHIYLGTSSWRYPGWCGRLYNPRRYRGRDGAFSQAAFHRDCLAEYAAVFPAVCGDFAFYQFPSEVTWRKLFEHLPAGFRFCLKVPEAITVERFPDLPRYGPRAGMENDHFLDPALLRGELLDRLEPYRDKLGVLILQFGTFRRRPLHDARAFARRLSRFLEALPLDRFRFAVEVRNAAYLHPPVREDYLGCLRTYQVAHCLNSWTRMPSVAEQLRIDDIFTAPFAVARFLLRPGRSYRQAVEQFAPYEQIRDPYPEGREALCALIERCRDQDRALYGFVNNRFEGNAVQTIEQVTESLEAARPRKADPCESGSDASGVPGKNG